MGYFAELIVRNISSKYFFFTAFVSLSYEYYHIITTPGTTYAGNSILFEIVFGILRLNMANINAKYLYIWNIRGAPGSFAVLWW